jgi:hypothetical protein
MTKASQVKPVDSFYRQGSAFILPINQNQMAKTIRTAGFIFFSIFSILLSKSRITIAISVIVTSTIKIMAICFLNIGMMLHKKNNFYAGKIRCGEG